jgi:hypothetical protein
MLKIGSLTLKRRIIGMINWWYVFYYTNNCIISCKENQIIPYCSSEWRILIAMGLLPMLCSFNNLKSPLGRVYYCPSWKDYFISLCKLRNPPNPFQPLFFIILYECSSRHLSSSSYYTGSKREDDGISVLFVSIKELN